jgi:hypothetical protein
MSTEGITYNSGGQMLLDETTHVVKTIVIIDERRIIITQAMNLGLLHGKDACPGQITF